MPSFDVDPEQITVFHIDDEYLFSHYFTRNDIFEELTEYYNKDAYRFEIPEDDFETVRERLADEYIELTVSDDLETYCVVTGKYDEYADILRKSVLNWGRSGHRFFLMKDEFAVKEAIEQGATPIEETDFVVGI